MKYRTPNSSKYMNGEDLVNIENKVNESKNLYVDEIRHAYDDMPNVDRAKKKYHSYFVIYIVFLVLAIVFVVCPIIAIAIALPHVDAHAHWFEIMLRICGIVAIIGIAFFFISRAAHGDMLKCRAVILSENDKPKDAISAEETNE